MDCNEIKELLEAYVLEALEPAEMTAVSNHLNECEGCRRLQAEYGDIVSLLPGVLAEASPWQVPDSLRASTLARIADLDQAQPISPKATSWWRRLRPSELLFWRVTAVSLFLILLLTGIWGWRTNTALAEERAMRTLLQNEFEKREMIFELVDSQTTQRTLVAPVDSDSSAYAKVYTRPDMSGIVVLGGRLMPPPEGYGYQVYFTQNNYRYLAGVLDVNEAGFGVMLVDTDPYIPELDEISFALQALDSTEDIEPVLYWQSAE